MAGNSDSLWQDSVWYRFRFADTIQKITSFIFIHVARHKSRRKKCRINVKKPQGINLFAQLQKKQKTDIPIKSVKAGNYLKRIGFNYRKVSEKAECDFKATESNKIEFSARLTAQLYEFPTNSKLARQVLAELSASEQVSE